MNLNIRETQTFLTNADRRTNDVFVAMLKCHWNAVEEPLRCNWSAAEVLLKCYLRAVEVLLKCQKPTANRHSHRSSSASSPIIHSRLVKNHALKQSWEKRPPLFLLKIVSSHAIIRNAFFNQRSPWPPGLGVSKNRVFNNFWKEKKNLFCERCVIIGQY